MLRNKAPSEKNRADWNHYANEYAKLHHADKLINRIVSEPSKAFHPTVWNHIKQYVPSLAGKRICVPSSGDNHAVFAFALLGAQVTSCDISEYQLANAYKVAEKIGVESLIEFVRADTMQMDAIRTAAYDFVYTSNGVHVWIDNLQAMYQNIYRILKPGGIYIMCDVYPYMWSFDDDANIVKPYDCTGPFESETNITFAWRIQDIVNAILEAGMQMMRFDELSAEKDYDLPFWIRNEEYEKGFRLGREEVDRMYDWKTNPLAALPNWMCIVARK